eukprot:scaffold293965_cov38-Prasinocladus_malaysianus.AAC.1
MGTRTTIPSSYRNWLTTNSQPTGAAITWSADGRMLLANSSLRILLYYARRHEERKIDAAIRIRAACWCRLIAAMSMRRLDALIYRRLL